MKIFNKYKKPEEESGERQTLGYGGNPKKTESAQYSSQEFRNDGTVTYIAEFGIIPPPPVKAPTKIIIGNHEVLPGQAFNLKVNFWSKEDVPLGPRDLDDKSYDIGKQIRGTSAVITVTGYVAGPASGNLDEKVPASEAVRQGVPNFAGKTYRQLAQARAEAVAKSLRDNGVNPNNIKVEVAKTGNTEMKVTIQYNQ